MVTLPITKFPILPQVLNDFIVYGLSYEHFNINTQFSILLHLFVSPGIKIYKTQQITVALA